MYQKFRPWVVGLQSLYVFSLFSPLWGKKRVTIHVHIHIESRSPCFWLGLLWSSEWVAWRSWPMTVVQLIKGNKDSKETWTLIQEKTRLMLACFVFRANIKYHLRVGVRRNSDKGGQRKWVWTARWTPLFICRRTGRAKTYKNKSEPKSHNNNASILPCYPIPHYRDTS